MFSKGLLLMFVKVIGHDPPLAIDDVNTVLDNVMVIFVYLSSRPVAHLSDVPRGRLVVTEDSARIQDESTENSAWFFNVLGV